VTFSPPIYAIPLCRKQSLFDLVRLERELSDALGVDADVVTPNSLHPIIRERVMEERMPLL